MEASFCGWRVSRIGAVPEPGQTLNVDLSFVPATHDAEQKLPAVRGSSGRLVIEQPKTEESDRDWPGRVFEDEDREYAEAMLDFVAASQNQAEPGGTQSGAESADRISLKVQKQAVHQEEETLRAERRITRQRRKEEDAAWKRMWAAKKQDREAPAGAPAAGREARQERWRALRQQRRETGDLIALVANERMPSGERNER